MKNLILFFVILVNGNVLSQQSAIINIDFGAKKTPEISEYLYGTFIEYYMCFRNNGLGMYAQEFENRGFDYTYDTVNYSNTPNWYKWRAYKGESVYYKLENGGYNKNAIYYQKIVNMSDTGEAGVYQRIYNTKGTGFDFYVWAKSPNYTGKIKVSVWKEYMQDKFYEIYSEININENWQKVELKLPEVKDRNEICILISFEGGGEIHLDEASIMPSNNIDGVRKYFYDAYKKWKPTTLRYPGGWFVEYSGYRWKMAIGDIDQRPVKKGIENVRMDFGFHEYIQFCNNIGIHPHITLSYYNNTAETAADLVEYCNGSTETQYGSKRAEYSTKNPYNVKLFEIGNEIWKEPETYSNDYNRIYAAMKKVDPDITCIVSGDIWQGTDFIDLQLSILKSNADIYGWHWAQPCIPLEECTDDEVFLTAVGGSVKTKLTIDKVQSVIDKYNLGDDVLQGITEIWTAYNPDTHDWMQDTTLRAGSLENGIWMADQMLELIRNYDVVDIVEKSASMATIRNYVKMNKERLFYTVPSYLANVMVNNFRGKYYLHSEVSSDTYTVKGIKGLFNAPNIPWINSAVTFSDDSLYIKLINRHNLEDISVFINLPENIIGTKGKVYQLYSDNYLDANTPDKPENIKISEFDWNVQNQYTVPKHSFTILALPYQHDTSSSPKPEKELVCYPNPFNNYFYIKNINEYSHNTNIIIYDINGNLIKTLKNYSITNEKIDTKDLAQGVYIIKIYSINNSKIFKMIKNK